MLMEYASCCQYHIIFQNIIEYYRKLWKITGYQNTIIEYHHRIYVLFHMILFVAGGSRKVLKPRHYIPTSERFEVVEWSGVSNDEVPHPNDIIHNV